MTDVNEPLLIRKKRTDEDQHSFGEQDEEEEGLRTDYGSGVYRYPAYLQPGHFTSLEKLMFFLSSILLILLFIFVGLYARSSQMDEDPLIPLPTKPDNHTKEQAYCLESNCIITAAQILEDVDRELDPCDDFYAYTCNKWQETHLIPDVKSSIDMPSITRDAIRHRLDQILNRDFNRLHKVSPHLPDPDRILDRQLFTKLSDFYHACMDQDMIEKVNIKPLYPLFRAIRDFIPLKQDPVDAEGLHRALSYLADRNIWTLFEMKVEPDPYQPTRPSLSLSQGQVGLPDRALYDDPDTMSVYMQVVTSMLDYVFKQDSTNEFGWRSWSAVATARRIIEFEKKVATTIVQRQPESWSLEQLEQAAPAIQWTRFIEQHRPQLPVPTHILVPTSGFMDHLTQDVLSTTNPRTLQMYFIWRTLWKYLDALDEPLVALKRPLDVKLSGIEPRATLERRDVCIDLIDASALGILMGRYFVLDHEDRILKSKASIQTMTAHIVKAFESRVSYLDWIPQGDDQTRHEILQKLATMEFQIGFPSDLQSVISLSDYLGPIQMDKTDFFGNMMRSNQHQVKQTWQLLQQPIDRHAWKVNAHSVKMAYDRELNKVMIPAGLLQLPYFDPEGPSYLYVGAIGWMIGHEIMHAFDTLGRRYNDKGIYGQWWSNNTPDQCLVSQYQAYGVDGNKTLDNNIADHGGLVLLESLIDHFENISIPGLNHHWNQDQLAYLQFARLKCSKSTKEHKVSQL
ncbi:uncharacterized protein B0P05DRAFT_565796 [Gilbertella persicaria]|uniref:uncharacterized protein n=1 Tax=Gilbertella persicaria TaxID=101096 RepID=UPI002220859A|nr:uncharacterized protein B0P05DRAFT_565796 [Gilbertella persicaria]KAI8047518.1 hypothetical protein B0P05DRAFT_565796 [Gilbertella persicaria]